MKREQETLWCCRGRGLFGICLAIAGTLAWLSPAQAGVTEDNFHAQTTNDMVAICSASQTDPLYSAAINFCQGFAVGSYQVMREMMAAEPKLRLFCVTEPGPTRNEFDRRLPDLGAGPSRAGGEGAGGKHRGLPGRTLPVPAGRRQQAQSGEEALRGREP